MRSRAKDWEISVIEYRRFAIYYTPPPGALADFGATWLGWDIAAGERRRPPPEFGRADEVTAAPRRYGFHATLKPPFLLVEDASQAALGDAVARLAGAIAPARVDALKLSRLGPFVALVPDGEDGPLSHLAATLVRDLDAFRAAPSPDELARRREKRLSSEEDTNLVRWGYPYVMDAFRFHMTLTGPLDDRTATDTEAWLAPRLAAILPRPFEILEVTLAGEDEDGFFHEIHRYSLAG